MRKAWNQQVAVCILYMTITAQQTVQQSIVLRVYSVYCVPGESASSTCIACLLVNRRAIKSYVFLEARDTV